MNEYDPVSYWTDRGRYYEAAFQPVRYVEQEAALLRVLSRLRFESVLDVGCGFGRIGALILDRWPTVAYTGLDLSAAQLTAARSRLPKAELIQSTISSFDPGDRRWDLVLAVEVLMHQRPRDLEAVIGKLRMLARRDVVTLDWTEAIQRPIGSHNFRHDYAALGRPIATVGLQSIYHVRVAA